MDWVKLGVRYYADEKIEALPDADAEMMFTRGLARAGELGLGGLIPTESLPKLARRRRYAPSVEALLAAGLWTRVEGGFQVTNWDYWQDSLDALAKRRNADRERQRRRRAAATESTAESSSSRDIDEVSRDVSRDVTDTEKEGDKRGVKVGDIAQGYAGAREAPQPRCPKHLQHPDPPPCGQCADARKAHNRWEYERAQHERAAPKCPRHRGQPAHNCAICRSEKLGAE